MTPFNTSREIPAPVKEVFAAISDPARLARWWGPAGFTNTFGICEFRTGGRWSFVMHGPDGKNYPNENVFAEIEVPRKVVIQHISEPKFRLTIELTSSAAGTHVAWSQDFENEAVARNVEHIVVPSNEQNLDRLTGETRRGLRTG
ncbi:MAG: SRPBCC domain-containing protein [Betaproteobacteria bacterium]|nr:SRPBCC domain-containing protein [Betaproteobacteria bacterium]